MIRHIWRKDLQAELYTWKGMVWLLIAALLFSFTSYLLLTDKELSLLDQTELLWMLAKIIIATAMLIVTIDASSIATAEFEKGTAESLFLAPVTLGDFILGKLLASLTLWFMVYVVAAPYIIVASSGTHLAGFFLGYVALFGTLGMIGLLCFTLAFSLLYRSGRNTLTTALAILLFLAIPALFGSTLKNSSMVAGFGRINPIDNIFSALDNVLVDYQIRLSANLRFLTPVVGFVIVGILFLLLAARVFKRRGIVGEAQ